MGRISACWFHLRRRTVVLRYRLPSALTVGSRSSASDLSPQATVSPSPGGRTSEGSDGDGFGSGKRKGKGMFHKLKKTFKSTLNDIKRRVSE